MMVVIAQNSDPEIDKAFIGKSLHTFGIIKAIMLQVEKNELASMVTSFFFKAATMLPQIKGEENPPSPQS